MDVRDVRLGSSIWAKHLDQVRAGKERHRQ
jgi:hypothetical protein